MGFVADKLLAIFETIIKWIFGSLIEPFLDLSSLKSLVFGRNDDDGSLVWATFNASELTDGLGPLYYTMSVLAGFFFVGFIALYGTRIAGATLNPSKRLETIELLKDAVFVGLVFLNLPTIYDLIFSVNGSIVNLFSSAYESESMSAMDQLGEFEDENTPGLIGMIMVQLVLLGLMVWGNFYYMMRKLTLIILMAMGPLMVVFWMHPQFKPMTGAWFKEFIGSVFVQAVHALVFWTVAIVSQNQENIVASVILYVIFIPISEAVRRLLMMGGDMQGGLAKAGSMMGMAGLAGMYGAAKGAINGKGVASTLRGAYEGTRDHKMGEKGENETDNLKRTLGANPGGDDGTSTRADKMLRSGDIVGRMGKATLGMAGAVAGSGLGPVGAMAGASAGFAAGGVVGGVAGRVGAGGLQLAADRFGKGMDAVKNAKKNGFDENLANEMAGRETASWADSNKDSVMSSLRERFPDASDQELESKFNKIKDGKHSSFYENAKNNIQSVRNSGAGKASGNSMVNASSAAMADRWADENGDAFLSEYDKKNPRLSGESAVQFNQRRDQALANKKDEMRSAFTNAGNEYVARQAADGNEPISKGDFSKYMNQAGADIVAKDGDMKGINIQRAKAMANQWETDNGSAFMADYDKQNPIQPGESQEQYSQRRQGALTAKKAEMQNTFANSLGTSNAQGLASSSNQAIAHVQGDQVFESNGKPNVQFLASSLAGAKTAQMGKQFVQQQMSQGVSKEAATLDWKNNHQKEAHSDNLSMYNDSVGQATQISSFGNSNSTVKNVAKSLGTFAGGATGVNTLGKTWGSVRQTVDSAVQAGTATHMTLSDENASGITNLVKTAGPSVKAGWDNAVTSIAEQSGGAVQAHANYQNSVAYGSGLLFGASGYEKSKNMANRFSPFRQQAQSEIRSPGEVIQMAQTTTDDYGNVQIAQGAIRQVTTADSSYIEVRTKSGEKQIVSRMGSGHSGMRKGDVVYQDLGVDGDQLVASNLGGRNGSSTYRVDSSGARVASTIAIDNDPTALLGNPRISETHQSINRREVPVYNQAVDSGGFYTDDLTANGFENVQVVIEKDRQFITANKAGETYRVSQIYSGDSRLGSKTVQIPVEVQNGVISPAYVEGSEVAVVSTIKNTDSGGNIEVEENIPYYSTTSTQGLIDESGIKEMMNSKHTSRANRSVEQRKLVDERRRKQGLLG